MMLKNESVLKNIMIDLRRVCSESQGSVKNQPGSESGARDGSEFYYWPNRLKIENLRELVLGLMGEKTRTKNSILSLRTLDRKLVTFHFFKSEFWSTWSEFFK